jgi:hypothetical protein
MVVNGGTILKLLNLIEIIVIFLMDVMRSVGLLLVIVVELE